MLMRLCHVLGLLAVPHISPLAVAAVLLVFFLFNDAGLE